MNNVQIIITNIIVSDFTIIWMWWFLRLCKVHNPCVCSSNEQIIILRLWITVSTGLHRNCTFWAHWLMVNKIFLEKRLCFWNTLHTCLLLLTKRYCYWLCKNCIFEIIKKNSDPFICLLLIGPNYIFIGFVNVNGNLSVE